MYGYFKQNNNVENFGHKFIKYHPNFIIVVVIIKQSNKNIVFSSHLANGFYLN